MISDQQWVQVKALLLARVGVNADTVSVGNDVPLRCELDWLDMRYTGLGKPATVKQKQACVDDALAQIDTLRKTFGPVGLESFYAGDEEATELRDQLDRLEANLRSARFDERARGNAHKAENEYWTELAKLWRQLVPKTRAKDTVTFVAIITGAQASAIRNYLYRSAR